MEGSVQSAQRIVEASKNLNTPDPRLENLPAKLEGKPLNEAKADAEMGMQPTSIWSDGTRVYASPMIDGVRTRYTIYRPDGSVESFKAFELPPKR